MSQGPKKENWGSNWGVILAVTGSAVGLGNFLRFPGQAAEHGGGAFMIPYICAFLFLGLPLAWAEWTIGRKGGAMGFNSAAGIYRKIWKNPVAPYFGVLAMLIPVIIYMYYVYIEGWCLAYAIRYLLGWMDFGADPGKYENFFAKFVGQNQDGSVGILLQGNVLDSAVFFLLISFVLNFILIYRGLTAGIEWFCKWAMPALLICALIILVRVLTLGTPNPEQPEQNLVNGLGYMWNPTLSGKTLLETLSDPAIWLAATGQIFFSLSVGFGIIVTYASYMKKNDDIALSSMTAAAGNGFCEVVLGGMMIIPAAFVFLGQSFVTDPPGTFGMGFVALPNVFNQMWGGQFFGFVFFFLLFLAAVTSSLSMLQPAIAFLEEGLGLNRKSSVALLGFITAIGGAFVVHFSKDLMALDTLDFWVGTFAIYVLGMFHVLLFTVGFGWEYGRGALRRGREIGVALFVAIGHTFWYGWRDGMAELRKGAEVKIPNFYKYIIGIVSPLYLLVVFVFWVIGEFSKEGKESRIYQAMHDPVAMNSILLILLVAVLFLILINIAVRRWKTQEELAEKELLAEGKEEQS
jgi:SNF family Na+-dependent transporter